MRHFFKALSETKDEAREKNRPACVCQLSLDGALSLGHTEEAMKRFMLLMMQQKHQ